MSPSRRWAARPLALLAGLLLTALLAGCGGQEITADEVPGAPVEVAIPTGAEATDLGGDADTSADDDADADANADDDSATGDDAAGTDDTSGTPDAPTGGASAPSAGATDPGATGGAAPAPTAAPDTTTPAPAQDDSANDSPPPAGSGAEKFEEFCQNNAGAC